MAPNTSASATYNADSISVHEGLLGVYERPGMYIDNTGKSGLHHLLWEVINNSVDEALAGVCDHIEVILNSDNSVTVTDNGRGIPVDNKRLQDGTEMPTVEVVMTKVHAGGKFGSGAYKYSGGLHGVGISVVNALSEFVEVEVRRDGAVYEIGFAFQEDNPTVPGKPEPGVCVRPLEKTGTTTKNDTGTSITFKPLTNGKFETTTWDVELIKKRLKFFAHIVAGVQISFIDERAASTSAVDVDDELDDDSEDSVEEIVYLYENGINDLVDERAEEIGGYEEDGEIYFDVLLSDGNMHVEAPILDKAAENGVQPEIGLLEIVAQWTSDRGSAVDSIVNGIPTANGGTHVNGVQSALVRTINRVAREANILDKDSKIKWEDISHGIILVINAYLQEPEFGGQTKSTLGGGSAIATAVHNAANRALSVWAKEHPIEMRDVAQRAVEEMQLRVQRAEEDANRNAQENRGAEPSKTVSPKLRDCKIHGEKSELIIVEGDSAGAGIEETRFEKYQALLPLMGKFKNIVSKPPVPDKNGHVQLPKGPITDIVNSLGCGTESKFNKDDLRYGRIIIMTDADDDGRHISLLILATVYTLMPELIYEGRLFEVRTPLFSGSYKDEVIFVTTEEERAEIEATSKKEYKWQRFKGLGQMDKEELFYHGIDPRTRVLRPITVERAHDAALSMAIESTVGDNAGLKWKILSSMSENDGAFPDWLIDNLAVDDLDDALVEDADAELTSL